MAEVVWSEQAYDDLDALSSYLTPRDLRAAQKYVSDSLLAVTSDTLAKLAVSTTTSAVFWSFGTILFSTESIAQTTK